MAEAVGIIDGILFLIVLQLIVGNGKNQRWSMNMESMRT